MLDETLRLPEHFEIERELREQLSGRAGHQRCIVGHDELLLILHEVPKAGIPERDALFFWKRMDGRWLQPGGPGIDEVDALFNRYAEAVDANELTLETTESTEQVFSVLRHAGPLARSLRNMVLALEQALAQEPDDRDIRALRDKSKDLERAADLLQVDARETLIYWQAEATEEHTKTSEKLGNILFRLNLVTGFFLPLVALASLLGMNVNLPDFLKGSFWVIVIGALMVGGGLLWYVFKDEMKK